MNNFKNNNRRGRFKLMEIGILEEMEMGINIMENLVMDLLLKDDIREKIIKMLQN